MSLGARIELISLVAKVGVGCLGDLFATGTVANGAVPRRPEGISTAWLTDHLCAGTPGAAVTGFRRRGGSDGTSSRRIFAIDYNQAGMAAGLPSSIFVKATPTFLTRLVSGMNNLAACEANFYNKLRPQLEIEAPKGYFGVWDEPATRSFIALEDIAQTRGATFADPTTRYLDREAADQVVDVLASLHGAFWGRPDLSAKFPWLPDARTWFLKAHSMMNIRKLAEKGIDRAGPRVPDAFSARRHEVWPCFLRSLDAAVAGPQTVLHQDVHAGNWFRTSQGRMGLYDWQCMSIGTPMLDVAYALMSGLTVEDRRAWEHDLLRRYAERIAEQGITPPTVDQLWLSYRQQSFHGLYMWLPTLGAGPLQPKMQPREISLANVERASQAIIDLEALDSFGPPPRIGVDGNRSPAG